jgi:hypothetical protein
MIRFVRPIVTLMLCVALGAGSGCGGNIQVSGKLTKGGKPLPPSQTGHVEIKLIPVNAKEHYTTQVGIVDEKGSFEIPDVPPGKYKVTVEEMGDPTNPASDTLGGQFSEQNTKIIREIDGKPLDIELNKPEG